ncbi:MAG: hypothetical protein ETSY1_30830 [Candidatus Entotheonella factor]|uniref:Linalool dehydratase/isomerase domain-containing protein n=1 Tax=Entotheonella factor TaxID=1429438 RepID=W4LCF7_ENTF1|nr:MAG: hypothetical protein ETSY1_30830 [Candidatus Entotheonella factor]
MLYGSDVHYVFHKWWTYAKTHYLSFQNRRPSDTVTLYYDPLIDYHHRVNVAGTLGLVWQLVPQQPEDARLLFEAAVEQLGWNHLDLLQESTRDRTTLVPTPRGTLLGLMLARELGYDDVYAKLRAHAEAHYEPTRDTESGEFTWGFGLHESYPRGQFNGPMAAAEAMSEGAWWRICNEPKLRKFTDPTVYGVDFPSLCLSQAWYDAQGQLLVIATDAGDPRAAGQQTTFRIGQIDTHRIRVTVDGEPANDWDWRIVDGEVEITTTVGEHTFLIRH